VATAADTCLVPRRKERSRPAPARIKSPISEFPDLLARLPAIVYVADAGEVGLWRYVSPQIQEILGFTPEEWLADSGLWASRLHPDDRARVLASEAAHLRGRSDLGASEYRMRHRSGRVVWIRDDAVLVRTPEGRALWHGVLSDITAGKVAERELERRAAQQAAVARLGEHALEGARPLELMQEAVAFAASILEHESAAVLELVPEESSLVLRAAVGWPDEAIGTTRSPTGAASHAGFTVLTRGPVVVEDWLTETRFGMSAMVKQIGARSGAAVPIEGHAGPIGVLGVQSTEPRRYTKGDLDFLQGLANVLADAIERQSTEDRIRHQALHDPLTGLPNRALFLDRLEHALSRLPRRQSLAAILFLDLDRFKLVNDSLGHQVGDELLAAVAPRLKRAVRTSDTVARFGGDEFGILLEDISAEHDAIEMAERIAATFTRPFLLAGSEHFVTTSIGIALARGGELAAELIRNADAAMYRAKERGSARYEVFDEAMRDRAMARLLVESDLRRALEREELRLEYQPLVSLRTREIVSAEALVRWDHPLKGLIGPTEFIPVAEENGLIEQIGRWVLEDACRQGARWYRSRPDDVPIGISVNLSAAQLARRGLPEMIADVLRVTGLVAACLSLEITESVILRDAASAADVLRELKQIGVRIVLDDFGTGYSSLAYLTRLPLDAIKIDRSFVDGLGVESRDTAVTEAILAMSKALSLRVVGEGVESEAQAQELTRLGCDLAQGFLFSRPVPAAQLTAMLRDGAPWRPQDARSD
jgi:diguanylate cyclase (GGDEF)-like protein/PAS domain S-box-containing protein